MCQSLQFLASLTTLTYLRLSDLDCKGGGEVLQSLMQLREISVSDCFYLQLDMFAPGAFPCLRALCIGSASDTPHQPYYSDTEERIVSKARAAILSISTLRQLSGHPAVLQGWLVEGQQLWNLVEERRDYVVWQKTGSCIE